MQAKALYRDLKEKDLRIKNSEAYDGDEFEKELLEKVAERLDEIDRELFEKSTEYLMNIKMMIVVTLIYEITRSLSDDEKITVRKYF